MTDPPAPASSATKSAVHPAPGDLTADDEIRILVATDLHVGYGENKSWGDDSIKTFEEALWMARHHKADMFLCGGDLFHENYPSRAVQYDVIRLLRKYCLGDRPVALEFLSDPAANFDHSEFKAPNYQDGNFNVALPFFVIHGNHDDLGGKGLTALDPLHEGGLLNLFGKYGDVEYDYVISPILLRKGQTKLALYGIGSQRDDRLARCFATEQVVFKRPAEDADSWFSLLTVHQNRPRRSTTRLAGSYVPDALFPPFLDLVVWGHEHECKKDPEFTVPACGNESDGFYILQPGSTVATSLTAEEAQPKHVFLISIRGRRFKSTPLRLESTRQVLYSEMQFETFPKSFTLPKTRNSNYQLPDEIAIVARIEEMLKEGEKTRLPNQPEIPLLRLRVVYTGDYCAVPLISTRQLGTRFQDRIANWNEAVVVHKVDPKKKERERLRRANAGLDAPDVPPMAPNWVPREAFASVEQLIADHFAGAPEHLTLSVLTDTVVSRAISAYCGHESTAAPSVSETQAKKAFVDVIRGHIKAVQRVIEKSTAPIDEDEEVDFEQLQERIKEDLARLRERVAQDDHDARQDIVPTAAEDDDDGNAAPMQKKQATAKRGRKKGGGTAVGKEEDEEPTPMERDESAERSREDVHCEEGVLGVRNEDLHNLLEDIDDYYY